MSWRSQDKTEEEVIFRRSIREFVTNIADQLASEARKDPSGVKKKLRLEAAKLGIMGLAIDERYGGQGASVLFQGIAKEELARSKVIYPLMPTPLLIINERFAVNGKESLVKKWMPKLLSGEVHIGIGSTEPASGSDVRSISTTATRKGTSYILNGEKGPVSGVSSNDAFYVLARTGPLEMGPRGVSMFLVEADQPGVEKSRFTAMEDTWELGVVRFNGVEVPEENLIGDEGKAFYQIMGSFDFERLLEPAAFLGATMESVEETIEYAKSRIVWGKPIAAFEGIMFPLVESVTKLEFARSYLYDILRSAESIKEITKYASMAHYYITKTCLEVLDTCIQVNGAQGYTDLVPHERRYRWIRSGLIGHGTQEIQRLIIGREIFGKEIYDMALGR